MIRLHRLVRPTALVLSAVFLWSHARGESISPQDPVDRRTQVLRDLRLTLDQYHRKPITTDSRSPWAVMHWAIAYGTDSFVHRGGRDGQQVSAIGWLLWNGRCAGQTILYPDGRQFGVHYGPGVEGHPGQLLAIVAQAKIKADYPIRVGGNQFTVADLIEHEKRTCESGTELTFKLIGLSHYLPPDATWQCRYGRQWSIEKLIREELTQPVLRGAACGGTHRMMGFSRAVHARRKAGLPMTGEFARAEKFVNDFHRYTFALQNADGSFSTEFFRRRSSHGSAEEHLESTGHIFEWLAFSLSDEEIRQDRMMDASDYLCGLLMSQPRCDWSIGPLGHALHGLRTYHDRLADKPWRAADSPSAETAETEVAANDD